MIVPPGVNKANGLAAALKEFQIEPCDVVGIGDAENDSPLLSLCGLGVAVSNAVPKLKQKSDFITRARYGEGITELIDRLLRDENVPARNGLNPITSEPSHPTWPHAGGRFH
jgi:hydroxymethylpyrimidine pyrophosphatase-like HAD family hydrolase